MIYKPRTFSNFYKCQCYCKEYQQNTIHKYLLSAVLTETTRVMHLLQAWCGAVSFFSEAERVRPGAQSVYSSGRSPYEHWCYKGIETWLMKRRRINLWLPGGHGNGIGKRKKKKI